MMKRRGLIQKCCWWWLLCMLWGKGASAQQVVPITNTLKQHIFTFAEIEYLEDPSSSFTFGQITSPECSRRFKPSAKSTPQNVRRTSAYWFRIRIQHDRSLQKHFLLEFFDQTIDEINAYIPQVNGNYHEVTIGDKLPFPQRTFRHKNFEILLDDDMAGTYTYYFRVHSLQTADVIIVLRSLDHFVSYGLTEYLSFGIFYGMILIFSFYNLIMFIAMRQRQYLYYVLYILSVALYEMCTDGIAYQYLWPDAPAWNQFAYGIPLFCMSIFALLFTRTLLHVRFRAPLLNKIIIGVMIARTTFLVGCLLINPSWFNYKFVEIIPLAVAFGTGIYVWTKGYHAARFFVLGYSFLFVGFMLKFFIMLGYSWLNFGIISYYSLSFCFILECSSCHSPSAIKYASSNAKKKSPNAR
ncbi:7TM diverse intracellular signaling domain-containing protein [Chitinophaga sp. MD30]|uniref:7TMR-DISM family protein n=1 Tax=Chitinophaga sp. MD30 TaxID=2033437 RepID=UPI0018DF6ACC|nr:7TM diverse intracellular signaling domain-containing protein [Chitinophaga sp. MD30]